MRQRVAADELDIFSLITHHFSLLTYELPSKCFLIESETKSSRVNLPLESRITDWRAIDCCRARQWGDRAVHQQFFQGI